MMLTSNLECNGSLEPTLCSHKAMWEYQHGLKNENCKRDLFCLRLGEGISISYNKFGTPHLYIHLSNKHAQFTHTYTHSS